MGEGYNGWTNYETWVVRLYTDNDQSQAKYWEQAAKDAYAKASPTAWITRSQMAVSDLADHLRDTHTEAADEMLERCNYEFGPFADLLRGSLSEVNWREIARHWIDAYCEEESHANG